MFAHFLLENSVYRAEWIGIWYRSYSMMQGIPESVGYSSNLMIESADFQHEVQFFSKPSFPPILAVEVF